MVLVEFDLDAYYLKGEPVSTETGLIIPCDTCVQLTTTLAAKTAALEKAEEYGRLCAKEIGMAGLDWGELVGEIRALRQGSEIYKKRADKAETLAQRADGQRSLELELRLKAEAWIAKMEGEKSKYYKALSEIIIHECTYYRGELGERGKVTRIAKQAIAKGAG